MKKLFFILILFSEISRGYLTPGGGGSGGGTPGGSSGQVQYNNGGAFGGFGSWNGSNFNLNSNNASASQLGLNYTANTYYSAGNFSGSNYISVPHSSAFFNSSLTISFWINSPLHSSTAQSPLSSEIADNADGWRLEIDGGNNLYIVQNGSGSGTVNLPNSSWAFIVMTISGTSVQTYLNGSLLGSGTLSTNLIDDGSSLQIGAATGVPRSFIGELQEIQLYTRILDGTEITNLYNSGMGTYGPLNPTNLIANYHLNGTPNDSSGNGHNGTWNGTASYTTGIVVSGTTPSTKYFNYSLLNGLEFGGSAISPWDQPSGSGTVVSLVDPNAWVQLSQIAQPAGGIPGQLYADSGNGDTYVWSTTLNEWIDISNPPPTQTQYWFQSAPSAELYPQDGTALVVFPNGIRSQTYGDVLSFNTEVMQINDPGGVTSGDFYNRVLIDGLSVPVAQWAWGVNDASGITFPQGIWDGSGFISLKSSSRLLYQTDGATISEDYTGGGYNSSANISYGGVDTFILNPQVEGNGLYFTGNGQAVYGNTTGSNSIQTMSPSQGVLFDTPSSQNSLNWFTRKGYGPNGSTINLDYSSNSTLSAPVGLTTSKILNTAAQTTLNGTAGTAVCSELEQGSSKKEVICYLSGFTGTGITADTYTYPTAFTHAPVAVYTGAGITPTITSTTVAFTSTLATGYVYLIGY